MRHGDRQHRGVVQGEAHKVRPSVKVAERVRTHKSPPADAEGNDGDQRLVLTAGGKRLYTRVNGKWIYAEVNDG